MQRFICPFRNSQTFRIRGVRPVVLQVGITSFKLVEVGIHCTFVGVTSMFTPTNFTRIDRQYFIQTASSMRLHLSTTHQLSLTSRPTYQVPSHPLSFRTWYGARTLAHPHPSRLQCRPCGPTWTQQLRWLTLKLMERRFQ